MNDKTKDWWVRQLDAWHDNGTFKRLNAALKSGQKVSIPRTDGSMSTGVITSTAGFGGRVINVTIDGEPPLFKIIDTDYFLEFNPEFGSSLLSLRPADERKAHYEMQVQS